VRPYRVAVDIGGTFTDVVLFNSETGRYTTTKVLSTPDNLATGVLAGLDGVVDDYSRVEFVAHGTTAALNAVLERRGAKTALVTTRGFRDVYEIGRGNRPDMYDIQFRKPRPLVPRKDVFEVSERVRADGSEELPVDARDVEHVIERLREGGYTSVAVCLLHSYINPEHEVAVARALSQALPGVTISTSHDVAREWREYERTSTTVLNSYIAPIIRSYLSHLGQELRARGLQGPLYIMQSNGGVMTTELASQQAIQTLLSGPVGGAIGGMAMIDILGNKNLISIDMGGTSFDVSLIIEGQPDITTETNLEGFPILSPMVNIHTIGAGGGSIAWVEAGGMRVGPQSAGADPGPACYGAGGDRPTVTDANLVLGRINPDYFLGGRMSLNEKGASRVVEEYARSLGLKPVQAAEGICRVANVKMADAIREITVRRGIDPRDFYLVAFGGAGPMHAAFIAEELEIPRVVVPASPGAFSAWGMLQTNLRYDTVRTLSAELSGVPVEGVTRLFETMDEETVAVMTRQGIEAEDIIFQRSADLRYVGQEYTVTVPFSSKDVDSESLKRLEQGFHRAHEKRYGYANTKERVEIVNLRSTGISELSPGELAPAEPVEGQPRPATTTSTYFSGRWHSTDIYSRDDLKPGHEFDGPAIVVELSSTTVVPPGSRARVDRFGNLEILLGEVEDHE